MVAVPIAVRHCLLVALPVTILVVAEPRTAAAQGLGAAPLRTTKAFWRIDGNTSDLTSMDPNWLTLSPVGGPVFYDKGSHQLRFYREVGKTPVTAGRSGSGPGEFASSMLTMGWIDDTLWVHDRGSSRLTYYSSAGVRFKETPLPKSRAASWTTEVSPVRVLGDPIAPAGDGSMIRTGSFARGDQRFDAALRVDRNGALVTTITEVPVTRKEVVLSGLTPDGKPGGMTVVGIPFPLDPFGSQLAVSPDGRVLATKHSVAISKSSVLVRVRTFGAIGKVIFDQAFTLLAEAVPDAVWAGFASEGGFNQEIGKLQRTNSQGIYAPIEAMVVGRDSVVWLQLRRTKSGTPLTLLGPTGSPLLRVSIPGKRIKVFAGTRTTLWVVEYDDDDVPSLVGYQVS